MGLALIIGSFCTTFLVSWILNPLALGPWRRSTGSHWAERARLLYPAQKSARLNNWLIPGNLAIVACLLLPERNVLPVFISGFLGSLLAGYWFSREVTAGLSFKSWLHLVCAALCVFLLRWLVLLYAILEMPDDFGLMTWLMAASVLCVLLGFQFGLGIYLLRWLRLLKPATAHLAALVAETSQKMAVPVRATWILSVPFSNAAAFLETRQLLFTDKLLATLTDDEVKAVCAHELGHLNESRRVKAGRLLVGLMFFPLVFARPMASLGENGTNLFWLGLITVLLAWLAGIRLAQRMEKRADKIAAETENAAVYARAMERIYEVNQTPAVMPRRAGKVHPDLYDRMLAAGVTPDFPRPAPAKGQSWTSILAIVGLFAMPVIAGIIKASIAMLDMVILHVRQN